jgi:hypothetical protein
MPSPAPIFSKPLQSGPQRHTPTGVHPGQRGCGGPCYHELSNCAPLAFSQGALVLRPTALGARRSANNNGCGTALPRPTAACAIIADSTWCILAELRTRSILVRH